MYALPDTLQQDIAELGDQARRFAAGELDPASFKIRRVPMGIYEQRRDGTFMVRVRTTGGVITPSQLAAVTEIAAAHGSDLLHITTRQEIQIQNVVIDKAESTLGQLQAIGLSSKGGGGNTVQNILVAPDSGVNGYEAFDPTPYAMALTTRLIAEPDSFTLPRKLKIAFAGSEDRTDYAGVNDIGLVAKIKNGRRGFKVYMGGSVASKPHIGWVLADFLPEEEIFILAKAVKKFFSEQGNRKNKHKARLRFIFYKLGQEETFRLFSEYFLKAKETTPSFRYTEPERRTLAAPGVLGENDGPFAEWFNRYARPQAQEGYYMVTLPFLHGNISLADSGFREKFIAFARWMERFGDDSIRFTPAQNILLRNIPAGALPELHEKIGELTDIVSHPLLINNIVSCTGADTCRLGICLSKGLASAIRRQLADSGLNLDGLGEFRLQISGCPNSCGQQAWADLGFNGKVLRNDRIYPGYQVYTGAGRGEKPALAASIRSIAARYVPELVEKILARYLERKTAYPDFRAYSAAEGDDYLRSLLQRYKDVPSFSEDKNPYYDWGSDQVFSVAGRGVAECSAGLFDMIDIDLKNIDTHREKLEKAAAGEEATELLYHIVHSASRMLLVTRGAELRSTADAFRFFKKLFIEPGIVSADYLPLIDEAAANGARNLAERQTEILSLADTVTQLYRTMDDSLQFKIREPLPGDRKPQPVRPAEEADVKIKTKDLRGVSCPMNFVQTKIELAKMAAGTLLEVWLDDGQPIANVPGSVRGEGHAVLEEVREGDHWKVIIRKK